MFYAEWLRVRNCLRICGIILGCLFLLTVALRIAVAVESAHYYQWIAQEERKPGAHVTRTVLSDGAMRTTIDDRADDVHAVIVDHGWFGSTMSVTGRGVGGGDSSLQIGTLGIATRSENRVDIDTNVAIPAEVLFFVATWVALIVGTVLAGPLAKENANHLEVSWTKPIGRERLAIGLFGVDMAGMLLAMAMTIVTMLLCVALFQLPRIVVTDKTLPILLLCVLIPFAWYALLTAAAASLKRGRGLVLGMGWLLAMVFLPSASFGLAQVTMQPFHAIGVVLEYLTLLDPLMYMHLNLGDVGTVGASNVGYAFGFLAAGPAIRDAALVVLFVLYSALSLVQWRCLEA